MRCVPHTSACMTMTGGEFRTLDDVELKILHLEFYQRFQEFVSCISNFGNLGKIIKMSKMCLYSCPP